MSRVLSSPQRAMVGGRMVTVAPVPAVSPTKASTSLRPEAEALTLARALLDRGPARAAASLTTRNRDGDTFLAVASRAGHAKVVRLLLDEGAQLLDLEAAQEAGFTALKYATRGAFLDIIRMLLDSGADSDFIDLPSRTRFLPSHEATCKLVLAAVREGRLAYHSQLKRTLLCDLSAPFDRVPEVLVPIILDYVFATDITHARSNDRHQPHAAASSSSQSPKQEEEAESSCEALAGSASSRPSSGAVWLADVQSKGRGRVEGRSWQSPRNANLTFTLLMQFRDLPFEVLRMELTKLNQAVCVSVCRAAEQTLAAALGVAVSALPEQLRPRVKWPNDVWIGGRKCSGMLIDSEIVGAEVNVVIGVGLNVHEDFRSYPDPALRDSATSVQQALDDWRASADAPFAPPPTSTPVPVSREAVLAAFLAAFEALASQSAATVQAAFARYDLLLGPATGRVQRSFQMAVSPARSRPELRSCQSAACSLSAWRRA